MSGYDIAETCSLCLLDLKFEDDILTHTEFSDEGEPRFTDVAHLACGEKCNKENESEYWS